ncbi:AAA family ATPase [Neobacillus sp. YX16]|uniref:AAA family ATPase n=1 Tax=Neobacillus sp. YX16 TaxID=3047874 RepID=UPI0024C4530F|nr:AAA family ATPase [Neobacillus sp. YX16]WHZ04451.1 AAA family ATPase [Neobacillus sp. YX16]
MISLKIQEIHIYGFGQLNNTVIKDLSDFQVFYGENEAGKSTIMAFIHGILFGFPTKQSSELRYVPKNGSNYGGKLRILFDELGIATIERVRGKASGDVTVTLADGTTGDETLLKQLLGNMDKGLFQAIFSFNIHGLQNIHQMKGEELGKFLFSTGTLGTERLQKSEAELEKELEARFKPSGKKPVVNEKLKALHELSGELKKAAAKNQEYEALVSDKESIQKEVERINNSLQEVKGEVEKLNEWQRIHSLVKEERWITSEIKLLGESSFPVRGVERLEKVNQLIYPYNAQISSLMERITQLKKEVASIQPEKQLLADESQLLASLDQIPIYEQLTLEKQQCELKVADLEEKISNINEKLHLPLREEDVLTINTNIYIKNQVEQTAGKKQKLLEIKQDLEEKFREEKSALEELEGKVHIAKTQMIPAYERAKLEKVVHVEGEKSKLEYELKAVQDKIEYYQHTHEQDKKTFAKINKQKQIQFLTIGAILLVLSLYGLFTKQWTLLVGGVLGSLLIGVFLSKNLAHKNESKIHQALSQLLENEKKLIQKLEEYKNSNISAIQEKLDQDNLRKEQYQLLKIKLEQQQTQYEKVIRKFEEWETEAAENKEIIMKLSSELHIPEYIAQTFFLEAFQLIEQYKQVGREKKHLLARLENINQEQANITKRLTFYSRQYLAEEGSDFSKIAFLLRNKLKEEHGKLIKIQEKQGKLDDLEADLNQMKQEQNHLISEKKKLLDEADVEEEEAYYEMGKKVEKKSKLIDRLADIGKQVQYSFLKEEEIERLLQIHNVEGLLIDYHEEKETLSTRLIELQEKQAAVNYQIQLLEEGGSYSEILHHYKQQKFELEEAAKEWSVFSLAQNILSKTVEKYKTVHLPRMLAKAEEYLFFLTEEQYERIHLQQSGSGFLIERSDHTLFEANELSQATAEQVYVSIRLALATTLYEKYHFPIIIDDSFVNFDSSRTKKVMELLTKFEHNQILFFTCHTHLLQYFQPEKVLYLHKGAVEVI